MSTSLGFHFFERGWLSANNTLLIDGDQAILIDSGYWTHASQTLALVRHALAGRPLTHLFNTHLHSDHCGGNAQLQAYFPDLTTAIPPGHAAYVRQWDPAVLTYTPTGQHCPPFDFDHVLTPGTHFRVADMTWEIHAAPGHDPHSLIFFCPERRWLLSADALWEQGFGVVFPELEGIDAFNAVGDTLDLIEGLQPLRVFPGHGRPFEDVKGALARARSRLEGFMASPTKHATHAVKVLLKFKLLELQQVRLNAFVDWARDLPYLNTLHGQFGSSQTMDEWIATLCTGLAASGAARLEGDWLYDA